MGYDIESVNGDRAKAAEFAKKYEYTYLFDETTGEYTGSDNLYFRANIWGMSMIRVILDKIVTLNGGEYPEVAQYVKEGREKQQIDSPLTIDDEVNADTNLVIEFLEFSDLCLGLDGYRVF